MFNLLTEQAKKNAAAEYRFRFWVVVCVFVCAEILLAFAGGTLSFISLRAEGKRIASDTAAQERARDARAGSALISSVQETGARVAVLAEHIPVSLSYGIATFVSLRQSEVRILAITAILAPEGGWSISASGISDTRDALAAFERTLKGDRRFADVDLPLASFAKDKTLPFTVTVAYRDTQP